MLLPRLLEREFQLERRIVPQCALLRRQREIRVELIQIESGAPRILKP
jgi:hypothetical protein